MKPKKTLTIILLPILVCLAIGIYYVKLSFSESLRFSGHSIQYLLLTPEILKKLPVEEIGTVKHYYYSAADGNKPLINAIEMESKKSEDIIETTVTNYLIKNGFTTDTPNTFVKDKQEISLGIEKSEPNSSNVNITLIENIN